MTTPSDLIEEVAKTILRSHGHLSEEVDFFREHRTHGWTLALSDARAAAAVIIEACANVADALHSTTRADGNGAAYYSNVSSAIRALAPVITEGK